MKNKVQISVIALTVIVLLAIQFLGTLRAYQDYTDNIMQRIEQFVSSCLSRELYLRMSNMGSRKFTRIKIKYADEMTEEERLSLKGDTIMVSSERNKSKI